MSRHFSVILLVLVTFALHKPCDGLEGSRQEVERGHKSCKAGWIKEKLFGHKMIILGDSNFPLVMNEFIFRFGFIASVEKVSQYGGCRSYKHLNMNIEPADVVWRSPKEQGIIAGPYSAGLRSPFCPDCTDCNARIYHFNHKETNDTFRLEYFPLLFGKDVSIQSPKYSTTQEHVIEYLKSSGYGASDYIVFNVGLHDMAHISKQQYGINLQFFSTLLATVEAKLIFVNTPHSNLPALPKNFASMYTVDLTDEFNEVATEVLARNRNMIGTVDTAPYSLVGTEFPSSYYRDGHHFLANSSFYNGIMMQTLYVVCSAAKV